ncbi:MAG: N-acetyltransferase [Bacteroidales bacterium]|nr:N-acetyltransferase [Bacteroidales bacterium]
MEAASRFIRVSDRFIMTVEGLECHLRYRIKDQERVEFWSTWVPVPLRGRGLAQEMIRRGLDWAGKKGLKVISSCSAVDHFIKHHPEYREILA